MLVGCQAQHYDVSVHTVNSMSQITVVTLLSLKETNVLEYFIFSFARYLNNEQLEIAYYNSKIKLTFCPLRIISVPFHLSQWDTFWAAQNKMKASNLSRNLTPSGTSSGIGSF